MPESVSLPTLVSAPTPSASAPATADRGATDAGSFDSMLQAGLAKRDNTANPAAGNAKPATPQSTKEKPPAEDAPRQQSKDEKDAANDPLVALLAYGAGDLAAALRASAASAAATGVSGKTAGGVDPAAAAVEPDAKGVAADRAKVRATSTARALIDPATVAKTPTAGQSAAAPDDTAGGEGAAATDPAAESAAAAQALLQGAHSAAGATRPSAATQAMRAETAPLTPAADSRARAQTGPVSGDAAAARRAPAPVTADAKKPADDGTAPQDGVRDRHRDVRTAPDPAASSVVPRADDKPQSDVKLQESKAAERSLDASLSVDTIARADAAPRTDAAAAAGGADRATASAVVSVDSRVGGSDWNKEFVSQVNLLVTKREPQAEIRVNPPQLGPVEVRIGMDGNQVSVSFSAAHAETRTAIENALPQLREMFADNGLTLGNTSVSAESSHQQQSSRPEHSGTGSFGLDASADAEIVVPLRSVAVNLVDTFA